LDLQPRQSALNHSLHEQQNMSSHKIFPLPSGAQDYLYGRDVM